MFEIRCYCEDKKLTELLWALDGKIVGQPQLLPVRDAKPSRDKTQVVAVAKKGDGTSTLKTLYAWVQTQGKNTPAKITSKKLAEIVVGRGGTRTSVGSYINILLKNGVLRRTDVGEYVTTGVFPEHLIFPHPQMKTKTRKENVHG